MRTEAFQTADEKTLKAVCGGQAGGVADDTCERLNDSGEHPVDEGARMVAHCEPRRAFDIHGSKVEACAHAMESERSVYFLFPVRS